MDQLIGQSMLVEMARRQEVSVVMGPQTYGPFLTAPGRMLARRSLAGARVALPVPDVERTRDVVPNVSGLLADIGWPHSVDLRDEIDHVRAVLAHLADPALGADLDRVRALASGRLAAAEDALRSDS